MNLTMENSKNPYYLFTQYLKDSVECYDSSHPHLTWAEAYLKTLSVYSPELFSEVTDGISPLDPRISDDNIPPFLAYVRDSLQPHS